MAALKKYGVRVSAIEDSHPEYLEVPEILTQLEQLVIGDCRQPTMLEAANIRQCRSIILVTRNERMNIALFCHSPE